MGGGRNKFTAQPINFTLIGDIDDNPDQALGLTISVKKTGLVKNDVAPPGGGLNLQFIAEGLKLLPQLAILHFMHTRFSRRIDLRHALTHNLFAAATEHHGVSLITAPIKVATIFKKHRCGQMFQQGLKKIKLFRKGTFGGLAFFDFCCQFRIALDQLAMRAVQFLGHAIESARQLAHFIRRAFSNLNFELAFGNLAGRLR